MMFLLLVEELDYLLLSLERDTKKLKFIKKIVGDVPSKFFTFTMHIG